MTRSINSINSKNTKDYSRLHIGIAFSATFIMFCLMILIWRRYDITSQYMYVLPFLFGMVVLAVLLLRDWKYRDAINDFDGLENVTDWNTPIPDSLLDTVNELQKLGFRYIGALGWLEDEEKMPEYWVYVNKERSIQAHFTVPETDKSSKVVVQLITLFSDNFAIETHYPFGFRAKTPNLQTFHGGTSLQEAYGKHFGIIEKFRNEHGTPVDMTRLKTWIQWDDKFGIQGLQASYKLLGRLFTIGGSSAAIILLYSTFEVVQDVTGLSLQNTDFIVLICPLSVISIFFVYTIFIREITIK